MPNPLMRLGQPKTSQDPPDRPQAETPVLEHVEGSVFPYRGMEEHGVPVHGSQFEDVPGHEGTVPAFFTVDTEPEHVVPVRVVQGVTDKTRRVVRTHAVPVRIGDPPTVIAGRNDKRSKVWIKTLANAGGANDVVWLSSNQQEGQSFNGYPLSASAGAEWSTGSQGILWGSCQPVPGTAGSAAGTIVYVYVAEEVEINLD